MKDDFDVGCKIIGLYYKKSFLYFFYYHHLNYFVECFKVINYFNTQNLINLIIDFH